MPTAPSAGIAWEAMKTYLRGYIIQYASHRKKLNTLQLTQLEKKIQIAETNLKQNMSTSNLRDLTLLKYEFNCILSKKVEFLLFWAKQIYFECGNKAGKFLASYIKQKQSSSAIPAVRSQGGNIVTNPKDINDIFHGVLHIRMLCN